jgi:hypothetical protein
MNSNTSRAWDPLHDHLEIPDVIILGYKVNDRCPISIELVDGCTNIAFEATRVVVKTGACEGTSAIERERYGSKVDSHILKRP